MVSDVFTSVSLRVMEEKDLSLSFKIYASTRFQEMSQSGWSEDAIYHFLDSQARMQHQYYMQYYSDAKYHIIELMEESIGRLYVHDLGNEIRIVDIALLPEYRNRGIGQGILRDLQEQGIKKRCNVSIHVEENNPALSLYRRLGFEFINKVNGIYHFMRWEYSKA